MHDPGVRIFTKKWTTFNVPYLAGMEMSGLGTMWVVSAVFAILGVGTVPTPALSGRPNGWRPVGFLRGLIARKLGRCARCIRLSLVFTILGWFAFAVFNASMSGSVVAAAAFVAAVGFTGLFASHLVAFTVRVMFAVKEAEREDYGKAAVSHATEVSEARRHFLVTSLKLIGAGLVAVTIPSVLLSGSAEAGSGCRPPRNCINICCCTGLRGHPPCTTRLCPDDPNYATCKNACSFGCKF